MHKAHKMLSTQVSTLTLSTTTVLPSNKALCVSTERCVRTVPLFLLKRVTFRDNNGI